MPPTCKSSKKLKAYILPRENLFPILGFVRIMSPIYLFLKRSVIGQMVKTLKTQKLKMEESVGDEMNLS